MSILHIGDHDLHIPRETSGESKQWNEWPVMVTSDFSQSYFCEAPPDLQNSTEYLSYLPVSVTITVTNFF